MSVAPNWLTFTIGEIGKKTIRVTPDFTKGERIKRR